MLVAEQHQKLGPSAPLGGNLELRNPQSNFSLFILLRCFYLLQVGKFEELSDNVTFKIIHFVQNIEIELKFHRSQIFGAAAAPLPLSWPKLIQKVQVSTATASHRRFRFNSFKSNKLGTCEPPILNHKNSY